MRLDRLDADILGLLLADARLSFREIAARLGSTTPTVAARVRAMEDIGLLQGYHARVDPAALGGRAYVLILSVRPAEAADAVDRLARLEGIRGVRLLPGGRIVADCQLRDLGQLHVGLADLPGLVHYDAFEVLRTQHGAPEELPAAVDVPCHQCGGPIHGDPVKAKLGGRAHVFCCRQCASTFRARFDSLESASHRRT